MENIKKIKCVYCGEEFEADTAEKEVSCPKCGETNNVTQALKLYQVMEDTSSKELKSANGEDYLTVESLKEQARHYLENENYNKAIECLKDALIYTDTDYTVYMLLVKAYTENYTKIEDKKHKEYLENAISVADEEGKKAIKEEYKIFYYKCKLSKEQLEIYCGEEVKGYKDRLEKKLKSIIPSYMAKDKSCKIYKLLLFILCPLGLASSILFLIFPIHYILNLLALLVFVGGIVMLRIWQSNRELIGGFNELLDLYDEMEKFGLDNKQYLSLLKIMYNVSKKYEDFEVFASISNTNRKICQLIVDSENEKAIEFIKSKKSFAELIQEF